VAEQQGGLITVFGDVLLAVVDWAWPRVVPRVGPFLERFAAFLRPNPPFTVQTPAGEILTGIIVLDQGRAVLFVGVRQPSSSPPPVWHPPPDPDEELFMRYRGNPYGR
jgi:hypothetical protein